MTVRITHIGGPTALIEVAVAGGLDLTGSREASVIPEAYRSGDLLVYDLNEVATRVEGAMA